MQNKEISKLSTIEELQSNKPEFLYTPFLFLCHTLVSIFPTLIHNHLNQSQPFPPITNPPDTHFNKPPSFTLTITPQ